MEWSTSPARSEWVSPIAGDIPGAGAREMERQAAAATPQWLRAARRAMRIHDDERAWRLGAEGEERIGRTLSSLDNSWVVVHDVPLSTSAANLDHLVIGPTGVFALNTKNLTGRIWVGERMIMHNGTRTKYLPASRHEARKTRRLLAAATGRNGPVTPVLVIMCDELTIKQPPSNVAVVTRRRLVKWLSQQPSRLTGPTVETLRQAALDPRTWPAVQRRG